MKKYTLLSLLALVIVTVSAAMPMFPNLLEGTVKINNNPAADGTSVEAKIAGISYGDNNASGGEYTLAVNGLTQEDIGKTIVLYVSNVRAGTILVEDTSMPKPARVKDLAITVAVCGNNLIEDLEICDGTALNSKQCTDFGYSSGILTCKADCSDYDKSQCENPPAQICGNSIIEGTELCDGNSRACTINGYAGTQSCNDICTAFNACVATESCGDNIKNGDEACDGSVLGGQTCSTKGFSSGDLKCKADCTDFDTSSCSSGSGVGGGGGNPPSRGPTIAPSGFPLSPPSPSAPSPTPEEPKPNPPKPSSGARGSITGRAITDYKVVGIPIIYIVIVIAGIALIVLFFRPAGKEKSWFKIFQDRSKSIKEARLRKLAELKQKRELKKLKPE